MKIQIPIDTSRAVSFIDVTPPEPVLDLQTNQHEVDANGEPLYSIELVCIEEGGSEILNLSFPGTPPAGIPPGGAGESDRAHGRRLDHRGAPRAHVQGRQGGAAAGRGRRNWPSSAAVVRYWA